MQFIALKNALKRFTIFSLNDIRKIDPAFYRARLNEWQNKGYIRKIIRGYYIFSDTDVDEPLIFSIANRIYSPSYISFESALSYHQLIPESVYAITSASSRRTYEFRTQLGEFSYRKIKSHLFWGYIIIRTDNRSYKIATPEKALLDFFYINSHLRSNDDFESLRINNEIFSGKVNEAQLRSHLQKFDQKALSRRIESLLEFLSREA